MGALAACLLAVTLVPTGGAWGTGSAVPQDTTVDLLVDDFEGPGLNSNWTVSDNNATNGADTWARSGFNAATGNGSAWAAGLGNRTTNQTSTVFTEGFEGNVSANWTTEDRNPLSGNDTWGLSTTRFHSGSFSYWSAAVGFNDDDGGDDNVNLSLYDNDMDTIAWRDVPPTGGALAVLSYWYWIDAEAGYDYLRVLLNVSGTWTLAQVLNGHAGTTTGWLQTAVYIPGGTSQLAFVFDTDDSVTYEGVYVDDLVIATYSSTEVFFEDFEGGFSGEWAASDSDSTNGNDYWNASSARAHGGTWSAWCAQEGYNDETALDDNRNLSLYDSGMDTIMWRSVDLANFTGGLLTFYAWLDSEEGYDYLSAVYFDGSQWLYVNPTDGSVGPTWGWAVLSAPIPATATRVGFAFQTDTSVILEGAYVDDVRLFGVPQVDLNVDLRTYDAGMNATMVASINMAGLPGAEFDYSYWVDVDSVGDALKVIYRASGVWNEAASYSGTSGGWQSANVVLPPGTDRVGFQFVSTGPGTRQGAYVDDVRVFATIPELTCNATAPVRTGVEGQTSFMFGSTAGGGIPPVSIYWDFGDGTNSTQQSPSHSYVSAGTYDVTVTARDGWGQQCTPPSIQVTVAHDVTSVLLDAPTTRVVEGQSVLLSATDAAGHALAFDWSLSPAACGGLAPAVGPSATFTADVEAGGTACGVTASFGGGMAGTTIDVVHDDSSIALAPSSVSVVEGGTATFAAVDTFGHDLPFNWSATCGSFSPANGTNETTYTAEVGGPGACDVTATFGSGSATGRVTVLHDLANGRVAADHTTSVEGSDVTLQFQDGAGHAIEAVWTVVPASCGQIAQIVPAEVVLALDASAGGLSCVVEGRVDPFSAQATITVLHDMVGAEISPGDLLLVEGTQRDFTFSDGRDHAVDVAWSLDPAACGSLSTTAGAATTVTLANDAGGSTCVLRASLGGFDWTSQITVEHGSALALTISPATAAVDEGGSLTFEGALADVAGHALDPSTIGWSSDCGTPEANFGASTSVPVGDNLGGTQCVVTASYGSLTANATVTVAHLGPFTVAVSPANGSMETSSNSGFSATVRDAKGHEITDALLAWVATCGNLQSVDDVSITYTAPNAAGTCTLTASAMVGSATSTPGTATVTVTAPQETGPTDEGGGLDMGLVGILAALVAGAVVGLLLWMRSRGGGRSETESKEGAQDKGQP